MKLSSLKIENFLGVKFVNVSLSHPVTLFAGKNEAGKSSIYEAIRMALTGESVRVNLKKNYDQLIRNGCESSIVGVEVDNGVEAFIELPSGKMASANQYTAPKDLTYVLNAQKFATLSPDERRSFLFNLMGVKITPSNITNRLLAKGCDSDKVNEISPMLRSGIEATSKTAASNATQERANWKSTTKETYGSKKAEDWKAPKVEFNEQELVEWCNKLPIIDEWIAKLREAESAKKHEGLIHDLARELESIMYHILTINPNSKLGYSAQKVLTKYTETYGVITQQKPESDDAAEVNQAMLSGAIKERDEIVAKIKELEDLQRRACQAAAITEEAANAHKSAIAWDKIADALSPSGIPSELLKEALTPINEQLKEEAEFSGWNQAHINSNDMGIWQDYGAADKLTFMPYSLLSESAQWRCDAMIAAAIAKISGVKLLMLDRFDVLDMQGRQECLQWLDGLTTEGAINNAILFGTLKEKPSLPGNMTAYWVKNGEIQS